MAAVSTAAHAMPAKSTSQSIGSSPSNRPFWEKIGIIRPYALQSCTQDTIAHKY
jgi:hypothetical protein